MNVSIISFVKLHKMSSRCDITGIGQKGTDQSEYLCCELKALLRCKFFYSLEPEWAAAATEVKEQTKGKVKLAAVDATVNQVLASRYGVST